MVMSIAKKKSIKGKIVHEMTEYWTNVVYLTIVFAAFTQYRRLVLAAHDITYENYWIAVIKALVFAKVVMVGDLFRLGRWLEHKPLIYSTLCKTVVFSIFVVAFTVAEHWVMGLWRGKGLTGGIADFVGKGHHEILANFLVTFVAFVPFFAMKELGRVLGEGKIWSLFFRKRDPDSAKADTQKIPSLISDS